MANPRQRSTAEPHGGERFQRRLFYGFAAVAALFLLLSIASAFWARNELTQVESVIALQLRMLDAGEPLYRDTNAYPFTISPYGPLYYEAALRLLQLGLGGFLAQRVLSILALLVLVILSGRIAWLSTGDRRAAATAGLLVASTALIQRWGAAGQSDMPALALSLWAFERFLVWRESRRSMALVQTGFAIALAIFTKQSFVAAGVAIAILAIAANRRAGLKFVALLAACGVAVAAALELSTGGSYLNHALRSHDNGFLLDKLGDQLRYCALVGGPLWIILAAAFVKLGRAAARGLHLYLALAVAVFLATAPKVGSDLNYQLELFVLLAIVSACSLADLDFFRLRSRNDRGWVTLLEIPLLLYLVLNATLAGRAMLERAVREMDWRGQAKTIEPYLAPERGRILSVELNPLVSTRGSMEVEPLIFTLLVNAGRVDGAPVLRDLENRHFGVVILYENLDRPLQDKNPEMPSLPEPHLAAIHSGYRLVDHIPGPLLDGIYVYQPKQPPPSTGVRTGF